MDIRKKIAIFFGGCSAEYAVSLKSASAVIESMDRKKYCPILIGIERSSGSWFWYRGDVGKIEKDQWREGAACVPVFAMFDKSVHGLCYLEGGRMRTLSLDAALPILHGKNGEDGTMQGTLELMGVPVIGCGLLSSAICMDKELAHRIAALHGIKVPRSVRVHTQTAAAMCPDTEPDATIAMCSGTELDMPDATIAMCSGTEPDMPDAAAPLCSGTEPDMTVAAACDECVQVSDVPLSAKIKKDAADLGYPLFVKPVRSGSSFGITKVYREEELLPAIKNALIYDSKVILEEAIEGFEVGCALLGTERPLIGEVDEIELSDGFFNYTEKYTLKTSKIHVPARISPEKAKEIKHTALTVYRALCCSHFARVDMFLTPAGEIYFNEVNTIPGFTDHSRYPNMLKAAGMTFEEIVSSLLEMFFVSHKTAGTMRKPE